MVNNFLKYKQFLHKLQFIYDKNCFYIIFLIYRYKDHPNDTELILHYIFKTYYIYSIEEYEKYIDEIILLCDTFGLRAYASVNYKNILKVAELTKEKIKYRISINNYNDFENLYRICSDMYFEVEHQIMLIDLDEKLSDNNLLLIINKLNEIKENTVIDIFDSKYGHHIILNKIEYENYVNLITLLLKENIIKYSPCIRENGLTLLYENINFINKYFEK